jgi:hypothetical protein
MTGQERRAAQASNDAPARHDDAHGYEPPRLVVMGSLKELTHGTAGGAPSDQLDTSEGF